MSTITAGALAAGFTVAFSIAYSSVAILGGGVEALALYGCKKTPSKDLNGKIIKVFLAIVAVGSAVVVTTAGGLSAGLALCLIKGVSDVVVNTGIVAVATLSLYGHYKAFNWAFR